MPTTTRFAFTIVEALVATTVVGLAGAAFALSLAASGSLRARAAARTAAARIASARVSALAARPCGAPDTAGVEFTGGVTESWSAHRSGAAWVYADSVASPPEVPLRAAGSVVCPP